MLNFFSSLDQAHLPIAVTWILLHELAVKIMPHILSTDQLDGGNYLFNRGSFQWGLYFSVKLTTAKVNYDRETHGTFEEYIN